MQDVGTNPPGRCRAALTVLALAALTLIYATTVIAPATRNEDDMLDRLAREQWALCQAIGQPSDEALDAGLTCDMLRAEVERISTTPRPNR